jgi:hypothetical protein
LAWLRNDQEEAKEECMRLEHLSDRRVSRSFSFARYLEPAVLKPLGLGSALFFFQQFR